MYKPPVLNKHVLWRAARERILRLEAENKEFKVEIERVRTIAEWMAASVISQAENFCTELTRHEAARRRLRAEIERLKKRSDELDRIHQFKNVAKCHGCGDIYEEERPWEISVYMCPKCEAEDAKEPKK